MSENYCGNNIREPIVLVQLLSYILIQSHINILNYIVVIILINFKIFLCKYNMVSFHVLLVPPMNKRQCKKKKKLKQIKWKHKKCFLFENLKQI